MESLIRQIRSNHQISMVFNTLNDGVIYEDEDGKIVFANQKYCQMLGVELSYITGKSSSEFVLPEDRELFQQKTSLRRHIQQEAYPIRLHNSQGKTLETLVSVQAIFDEHHRYSGNVAVISDITALQEQKQALEESETKFKTLLAASKEGIFIHDNDLVLLEANDQFFEMYGYEAHELVGKPLLPLLLTDESAEAVFKHIQARGEGPLEFTTVHKNGTLIPVLGSARNSIYMDREVRIVAILDLRELKRREFQLAKSVQRFQDLARQSGTFLWEVNAVGRYTYLSSNVEQIIGYRPDEVVNQKYFYDLHPEQGRDEFKAATFEIFKEKKPFHGLENPIQATDGRIIHVITYAFPILAPDGTLLGYQGSDTDITEIQQLRHKLLDLHTRLSQTERLAGLGTMVAAICHEINQPLTIMKLGMQELQHRMEQTNERVSRKKIEQFIHDSLSHISACISILHDYRTFSRLNTPSKTFSVDLCELFENLAKVFNAQCRKNNVTIRLDQSVYQSEPFITTCDIEQIAFILLHNAIDASSGPQAHQIKVSIKKECQRLLLNISDQGHGISPEDQKKIFQPFFTTKPRDKGTGLGLSIVKRIMNNCNGEITFTSIPGSGTTFSLVLPAMDSLLEDNCNGPA